MIWNLQRRHIGGRKWKIVEDFPVGGYSIGRFNGTEQDACAVAKEYVGRITKRADPDGEFRLNRDGFAIPIPRS